MKIHKIYILLIVLFQCLSIFGQTDLSLVCSLKTSAKSIKIDALENVYFSNSNELSKYKSCEKINQSYIFRFNNDDIYTDITNPFKILVYYSSNNTIEYINNQFSSLGNSINLTNYYNSTITLACTSYDNGIWVYNASDNTIIRLNSLFTKTNQSNPIVELYQTDFIPNQLFEKNEQVYLGIPNFGVLVFDKYGIFKKRIPIQYQIQFNILNSKFYFINNKQIMAYDPNTFETATILTEDSKITSFDINSKHLVIITENGVFKQYLIPQK